MWGAQGPLSSPLARLCPGNALPSSERGCSSVGPLEEHVEGELGAGICSVGAEVTDLYYFDHDHYNWIVCNFLLSVRAPESWESLRLPLWCWLWALREPRCSEEISCPACRTRIIIEGWKINVLLIFLKSITLTRLHWMRQSLVYTHDELCCCIMRIKCHIRECQVSMVNIIWGNFSQIIEVHQLLWITWMQPDQATE